MKKIFILIAIIVLCQFGIVYAQQGREQIESAKIALITERLNLTPETAQKFWPLYNQIWDDRRALRDEEFRMRRSVRTDSLTDERARQLLDQYNSLKKKQLELELNVSEKFQGILTPVQIVQLMKAEEDFRSMVMNKLRERHRGSRDHRPEHP